MRNEGKKNKRRSTPPSFGILLLPRQIGSEHVLHHKLPSKQTKKKKDGFQCNETRKYWSSSPSRSRSRRSARKTFSLFLSLSLCWEKIHSPRRHSFWLILRSVHHSVQFSKELIMLCNHRQHHLLPSKGREREIRDLSRARTAREQLKRAWERYKTKKPLSSSYSYLKLTHIILRWNQSRRTAHKILAKSCINHRQSKSTPPLLLITSALILP